MIVYFDLFLGILAANQEISVSFFLIFSSSYFICYLVSLQSMFFLSFNLLCFSVKLLLKKVTVYDFRVFWVCFFMIWLQGYIQNIRIPHICWYNTNETLLVSCNPLHWWCAIFAGVACSGSCISCLLEQPIFGINFLQHFSFSLTLPDECLVGNYSTGWLQCDNAFWWWPLAGMPWKFLPLQEISVWLSQALRYQLPHSSVADKV